MTKKKTEPVSRNTQSVVRYTGTVLAPHEHLHLETRIEGPSITEKHQAEDQDIHTILKRFGVTGGPHLTLDPREPFYGDFSEAGDLQRQFERVTEAFEAFHELPAELRARFENDPVMLLEFMEDPANIAEGVQIGLYDESALRRAPTPEEAPIAPAADPVEPTRDAPPQGTPPTE